jgi:putative ABC transport system permease protein
MTQWNWLAADAAEKKSSPILEAAIDALTWLLSPSLLGIGRLTWITLAFGLLVTALLLVISRVPLSYNLNNLRVRWKNTGLTALAFTLVLSVMTLMLAFVAGMTKLTESSGHPENVIVLSAGTTDEGFSTLGFSDVGDIANQSGVELEGAKRLASQETYMVVNQPLENAPPNRPKRRFLQMRGIDDPQIAGLVHTVTLDKAGAWFTEAGVREGSAKGQSMIECVVGEGLARQMARDDLKLQAAGKTTLTTGDTFVLNERTWVIAGVMQSSGSLFDSEVWAKRSLVGAMFGKNTYTTVVLRAKSADAAKELARFLKDDYTKARLSASVETDYYTGLQATNKQFLYAIWFVTIILAIGGVFGVMNTMFAAISARRKDIGVLRLMGFRKRHVVASFMLESIVLGMIGGVLGCLVGSLCDGWTANSSVSSGAGGGKTIVLKLVVDLNIWLIGIALSFVMAFIGGLLPAINAIRLKTLDVLR